MYIVQLDFECVRDISNILFYSGMQWYACINLDKKSFKYSDKTFWRILVLK